MVVSKVSVCIGTQSGSSVHLLHLVVDRNNCGKIIMKFLFAPGKGGIYSDPEQIKDNIIIGGDRDVLHDGKFNISEFTYHDDGGVAWKWPSYNLYRSGSTESFDQFPAIAAIDRPFCFAQIIVFDKATLSVPINLTDQTLYLKECGYPMLVELVLSKQKFRGYLEKCGAICTNLFEEVCFCVAAAHVTIQIPRVVTPVGTFEMKTVHIQSFKEPNYITIRPDVLD